MTKHGIAYEYCHRHMKEKLVGNTSSAYSRKLNIGSNARNRLRCTPTLEETLKWNSNYPSRLYSRKSNRDYSCQLKQF